MAKSIDWPERDKVGYYANAKLNNTITHMVGSGIQKNSTGELYPPGAWWVKVYGAHVIFCCTCVPG